MATHKLNVKFFLNYYLNVIKLPEEWIHCLIDGRQDEDKRINDHTSIRQDRTMDGS